MLDMLSQDCMENKKEFLKNIQELAVKNKEVIDYILDSDMLNNVENHYSERQKKVVNKILIDLRNSEYIKVKKLLVTRELVNKFRKVIK